MVASVVHDDIRLHRVQTGQGFLSGGLVVNREFIVEYIIQQLRRPGRLTDGIPIDMLLWLSFPCNRKHLA
jgi:hypothetical protein